MDDNKFLLPQYALINIEGGTLFYPYCNIDKFEALFLFSPHIRNFWFIDREYFGMGRQTNYAHSIFSGLNRYELENIQISGSPSTLFKSHLAHQQPSDKSHTIGPYTRTEIYLDRYTGKTIKIHIQRANEMEALKSMEQISVFFFRGDNYADNSDTSLEANKHPNFLSGEHFPAVLEKMTNNGLIVTDGSGCEDASNPYLELARFYGNMEIRGEQAMSLARSFSDKTGQTFQCIGYGGLSCGPTLIWQVAKSSTIS